MSRKIVVVWLIMTILVACNGQSTAIAPAVPTLVPSVIVKPVSSLTPNFQPTETLVPTNTPFPTPIATLDENLARQRVLELFQTNNSCKLPSWWGITPGKTTWDDALKILAPISRDIKPL
jgi:hypothetical protein